MDVGATPVSLGTGAGLIQNLGPDDVYVGWSETSATETDGVKLSAGRSMSTVVSSQGYYVISAGSSDVRRLGGASGIFTADAPDASV